jgi:AhpD family alkylhydroperoxidase
MGVWYKRFIETPADRRYPSVGASDDALVSDHGGTEGQLTSNDEPLYPQPTREPADMRTSLAHAPADAFRAFSRSVFAEGALTVATKQLIAVAVAHVTQCPYCIRSHTQAAMRHGATPEQIMEAIWVAAEMRAGGAYAHSNIALDEIQHHRSENGAPPLRGAENVTR